MTCWSPFGMVITLFGHTGGMNLLCGSTISDWFSATHWLVLTNVVLAAAALLTIRSSNRVARSAEEQASATKGTVEKASDQIELGRRSLEIEGQALLASTRPLVIDVPRTQRKELFLHYVTTNYQDDVVITALFRNVGNGPAIVHRAFFQFDLDEEVDAYVDYRVIAVGEVAKVTYQISFDEDVNQRIREAFFGDQLSAGLFSKDLSDTVHTLTLLHVGPRLIPDQGGRNDEAGTVQMIEIFGCSPDWSPASDPFISSGKRSDPVI